MFGANTFVNTVTAVKIDGAGIKAWLEQSAGWFNRIDPAKTEPKPSPAQQALTDVCQALLSANEFLYVD